MVTFGPKPWVNPLRKILIFRLFKLLLFIAQRGISLVLEYRKRNFPALSCQKKKVEKWPFLDQNHGLTTLQKCSFLNCLNFLFLQPRKAFFRSRLSEKTFSWSILLKKKKVRKMAILGPKPWVKPFRKKSIFRLFERLVFIVQKGIFWFQNTVRDIFMVYIA